MANCVATRWNEVSWDEVRWGQVRFVIWTVHKNRESTSFPNAAQRLYTCMQLSRAVKVAWQSWATHKAAGVTSVLELYGWACNSAVNGYVASYFWSLSVLRHRLLETGEWVEACPTPTRQSSRDWVLSETLRTFYVFISAANAEGHKYATNTKYRTWSRGLQ